MQVTGLKYFVSESINNRVSNINTFFVGEIISVNSKQQRYSVRPVLNVKNEVDNYIPQAIIVECPVAYSVSAHHVETNPFSKGDLVYVGISKEDIDIQLSGANKNLDTRTYFRMVDGVILGGINKEGVTYAHVNDNDYSIYDKKTGAFIIMRENGMIDIFSPEKVKVVSPLVDITANVQITGNVSMTGSLTVGNGASITGNISATGNSSSSGTSTASDHISGGISGKSHIHSGVQTGGGSTGAPR